MYIVLQSMTNIRLSDIQYYMNPYSLKYLNPLILLTIFTIVHRCSLLSPLSVSLGLVSRAESTPLISSDDDEDDDEGVDNIRATSHTRMVKGSEHIGSMQEQEMERRLEMISELRRETGELQASIANLQSENRSLR